MSEGKLDQVRDRFSSAVRAVWWLTLLRGAILIVFGIYALLNPTQTIVALTQVLGFFLVLDGSLAVWAGVSGQTPSRIWTMVRGVLEIVAGLFVITHPVLIGALNTTLVVCLIAFALLASGIAEVYLAIRDRHQIEGEGWFILGGVCAILLGVLILMSPLGFGVFLMRVIGGYAIVAGIVLLYVAFRVRSFGKKVKA